MDITIDLKKLAINLQENTATIIYSINGGEEKTTIATLENANEAIEMAVVKVLGSIIGKVNLTNGLSSS